MNLYAIRDRLVDYFMTPFAAHEDKGVLNSLSNLVSKEGNEDPVAQAPHHFEIWRLAKVDEQGHIEISREFLADCSSLVRTRRPTTEPGPTAVFRSKVHGPETPTTPHSAPRANERPPEVQAQGPHQSKPQGPQGAG